MRLLGSIPSGAEGLSSAEAISFEDGRLAAVAGASGGRANGHDASHTPDDGPGDKGDGPIDVPGGKGSDAGACDGEEAPGGGVTSEAAVIDEGTPGGGVSSEAAVIDEGTPGEGVTSEAAIDGHGAGDGTIDGPGDTGSGTEVANGDVDDGEETPGRGVTSEAAVDSHAASDEGPPHGGVTSEAPVIDAGACGGGGGGTRGARPGAPGRGDGAGCDHDFADSTDGPGVIIPHAATSPPTAPELVNEQQADAATLASEAPAPHAAAARACTAGTLPELAKQAEAAWVAEDWPLLTELLQRIAGAFFTGGTKRVAIPRKVLNFLAGCSKFTASTADCIGCLDTSHQRDAIQHLTATGCFTLNRGDNRITLNVHALLDVCQRKQKPKRQAAAGGSPPAGAAGAGGSRASGSGRALNPCAPEFVPAAIRHKLAGSVPPEEAAAAAACCSSSWPGGWAASWPDGGSDDAGGGDDDDDDDDDETWEGDDSAGYYFTCEGGSCYPWQNNCQFGQVYVQTYWMHDQPGDELGDQADDQLGDELGDQADDQLGDQLGDQADDQLGGELGDQLYSTASSYAVSSPSSSSSQSPEAALAEQHAAIDIALPEHPVRRGNPARARQCVLRNRVAHFLADQPLFTATRYSCHQHMSGLDLPGRVTRDDRAGMGAILGERDARGCFVIQRESDHIGRDSDLITLDVRRVAEVAAGVKEQQQQQQQEVEVEEEVEHEEDQGQQQEHQQTMASAASSGGGWFHVDHGAGTEGAEAAEAPTDASGSSGSSSSGGSSSSSSSSSSGGTSGGGGSSLGWLPAPTAAVMPAAAPLGVGAVFLIPLGLLHFGSYDTAAATGNASLLTSIGAVAPFSLPVMPAAAAPAGLVAPAPPPTLLPQIPTPIPIPVPLPPLASSAGATASVAAPLGPYRPPGLPGSPTTAPAASSTPAAGLAQAAGDDGDAGGIIVVGGSSSSSSSSSSSAYSPGMASAPPQATGSPLGAPAAGPVAVAPDNGHGFVTSLEQYNELLALLGLEA